MINYIKIYFAAALGLICSLTYAVPNQPQEVAAVKNFSIYNTGKSDIWVVVTDENLRARKKYQGMFVEKSERQFEPFNISDYIEVAVWTKKPRGKIKMAFNRSSYKPNVPYGLPQYTPVPCYYVLIKPNQERQEISLKWTGKELVPYLPWYRKILGEHNVEKKDLRVVNQLLGPCE